MFGCLQALVNREVVCGICTEEDDDFIPVNPNCHLVLLMDPLDGASLLLLTLCCLRLLVLLLLLRLLSLLLVVPRPAIIELILFMLTPLWCSRCSYSCCCCFSLAMPV